MIAGRSSKAHLHSKIPGILIFASFASLGVTRAESAPVTVRYACPASDDLSIRRDVKAAHVQVGGHVYDLRREHSSIGAKYISSDAALIIDGRSAVFVATNQLDVGRTCVRALPIASR